MSAAVALPVLGRLTVHCCCGAGGPACGSSRCRFTGALSSLEVVDINLHAQTWGVGAGRQGLLSGTGYVHPQYLMGWHLGASGQTSGIQRDCSAMSNFTQPRSMPVYKFNIAHKHRTGSRNLHTAALERARQRNLGMDQRSTASQGLHLLERCFRHAARPRSRPL